MRKIKNRKRYTWLARKISLKEDQVKKIKKLEGIYIESVPKRIYPNHELMSQTLGFVGVDNKGLSGVEHYFDDELRGEPKKIRYIKDAKGRALKFETRDHNIQGKDITLTIDKELQAYSEKVLKEAVLEHQALKGGVGIMDARTGEILAMANYPTFDADNLKGSKPSARKLSFISDPFEPGSTFKILTVASALENNIATPSTSYFCERGRLKVGDHIIKEAESNKKYEWLTVSEIIKYSSNVGTTKIAFDLAYPKLLETLEKFGIGNKTGVELNGESRGILTNDRNINPLRLSNISFGQGVATTGIQMLAVYSAIANGGVYVEPTLIKGKNKERKRVLSRTITKQLEKMLIETVESGTGKNAQVNHFVIAGKTSTAQKPAQNGGYDKHVPGFIGYPVNIPNRFVIYTYVDSPEGRSYYGNTVAAPIFKKIAQYMLYNDKKLSKFAKQETSSKSSTIDKVKMKKSSTKEILKGHMPSFIGMDKRTVSILAKKHNLKVDVRGIGIVKDQYPRPGTKILKSRSVRLNFRAPSYD